MTYEEAWAALQDPMTDALVLATIAEQHPELAPHIAAHPQLYPGLREWLIALEDPRVDQALGIHREKPVEAPPPIQPHQSMSAAPPARLVFRFDGSAGSYVATALLAFLITAITLGILFPYANILLQKWRCEHTYINGMRLRFTGTLGGIMGHWIVWLLLTIITLGIYSFWVVPRYTRWIVEHQEVDQRNLVRQF